MAKQSVLQFLESALQAGAADHHAFERRHVAVAALLVEAARNDHAYDEAERALIAGIIRNQFKLPEDKAQELLILAEVRERLTLGDWVFCKAIAEGYSAKERADIVAELWRVAVADNALHRFETRLIERVALQLGVSWEETVATRVIAEEEARREGKQNSS